MYKECPFANEECKYFDKAPRVMGAENGCYSDLDHIVPKRLANTALASLYINSPDNKQQLCRDIHDEKTKEGDEPLPSREEMRDSLRNQIGRGAVRISKSQKKQAGL